MSRLSMTPQRPGTRVVAEATGYLAAPFSLLTVPIELDTL